MFDNELAFDKLIDSLGAERCWLISFGRRRLMSSVRTSIILRAALTLTFPTAKARRERGT